jgi:tetratricopeptide (TPR) repeat protein
MMGHLGVFDYDLAAEAYRKQLLDYLGARLGADYGPEGDRGDLVIAAADRRFAYVSFLADRIEAGRVDTAMLDALAGDPSAGRGEQLYVDWLRDLPHELGGKRAGQLKQMLATLAAVEAAHEWVFTEGFKPDPADPSRALTPLDETFSGLTLAALALLLDLDRPDADKVYERVEPDLHLRLEALRGVLQVARGGTGSSRFRLELKAFLPVARAHLDTEMRRAHAHLVHRVMDLAGRLADADLPGGTAEALWPMLLELAPYGEAAVRLGGPETAAAGWDQERLTGLILTRTDVLVDRGIALGQVPIWTVLTGWKAPTPGQGLTDLDPQRRNFLAGSLQNRGLAKADGGDLAGAVADYDAAIAIREGIRAAQGPDWSVPLRNDLAAALQNRGNAKAKGGDLTGAVADYDAAIAIMEGIRDAQGPDWSIPLRNDLATALQNRGAAKTRGGDLTGAMADFDAAIAIQEGIRAAQGPDWSGPLRKGLANSLQNRGTAKFDGGDLAGAVADFDAAIAIMEGIRAAQGPDWSIPLRNDLAGSLQNRGTAKAKGGDLTGAMADYDAAIAIQEGIRDAQGADWSIPLRAALAMSLQNRGNAKAKGGDLTGAVADFDAAIEIMEGIRAVQGPDWSIPLRNELATCLMNRGNVKFDNDDLAGAVADYDAAIAIQEGIRYAQGADWSIPLRAELAMSLQNRGDAKRQGGDLAAAVADQDAAIEIMEGIRAAQGPDWSIPLRNDLAGSLQNRGNAKADGGDLAGAVADYDAAIAIQEGIRDALGAQWPPPMQIDLALTYYYSSLIAPTAAAREKVAAALALTTPVIEALDARPPAFARQLHDALLARKAELDQAQD